MDRFSLQCMYHDLAFIIGRLLFLDYLQRAEKQGSDNRSMQAKELGVKFLNPASAPWGKDIGYIFTPGAEAGLRNLYTSRGTYQ